MPNLEFKLKPKQRLFVESQATWCAFIGGVGSGKTHAGAVKSLIAAVEEPGSLGVICAPTFSLMRDTSMRTFFSILPEQIVETFNKNEGHLTLSNGSEILFRSMDNPDRIRGANIAWAWLDEATFAGHYAWKMIKERAGRQDAAKYKKRAWITATPRGRDEFWREFVKVPTEDHYLVQVSTRENLSNLPDGYIDSLGLTGAFFNQEIEGSFEAFTGLVYQFNPLLKSDGGHVVENASKRKFSYTIGSIDWGYRDPAVALVFGVSEGGTVWLIKEFYERGVPLGTFIDEILDMTKQYHVETWYADPSEAGHIDQLRSTRDDRRIACDVIPAENAIVFGIQSVQKFLARNVRGRYSLYVDESCVNTINEFMSYQFATNEVGDVPSGKAEKPARFQQDHAMDAVRYALHTHFSKASSVPIEVSSTSTLVPARSELGMDDVRWEDAVADNSRYDMIVTRQGNMRASFDWLAEKTRVSW